MSSEDFHQPALLTIGTCNRRAGIVAVVESFVRYHPGANVFVCLVDRPPKEMPPLDIPATVFFADELALPGGRRFLFKYDAFELCCALKPFAIAHVAQQHGTPKLVYLDSDILVLGSFWEDLKAAWAKHSVLLTPHLAQLPGEVPLEFQRSLAQHGAYNAGFIAVNSGEESNRFLHCWSNLVTTLGTFDPMNNINCDQRWLDLLAASSDAVGILRDAGLNVAYWNLHERKLTADNDNSWKVNGQRLKFFHFSGFHREKLTNKAKCDDPDGLEFGRQYGELLDHANDRAFRSFPYGWDFYDNGKLISPAHRDLILSNCDEFRHIEDPFLLPTLSEWTAIEEASAVHEPFRLTQQFLEYQANAPTLSRLRRHPVIGTIWKLWERFINPSLSVKPPSHGAA